MSLFAQLVKQECTGVLSMDSGGCELGPPGMQSQWVEVRPVDSLSQGDWPEQKDLDACCDLLREQPLN